MLFQGWRNALGRWLLADPSSSQQGLNADNSAVSESSAQPSSESSAQSSAAVSAAVSAAMHSEARLEATLPEATIPQHWLNKVSAGPPQHWLEKVREGAPDLWESLAGDRRNDLADDRSNEGTQLEHLIPGQSNTVVQPDVRSQHASFQESAGQFPSNSQFSRSVQSSAYPQDSTVQGTQFVSVQPSADPTSSASSFSVVAARAELAKDLPLQSQLSHTHFSSESIASESISPESLSPDRISLGIFSPDRISQNNGFSAVPSPLISSFSNSKPPSTGPSNPASVIRSIAPQVLSSPPVLSRQPHAPLRFSTTLSAAQSSSVQPPPPPLIPSSSRSLSPNALTFSPQFPKPSQSLQSPISLPPRPERSGMVASPPSAFPSVSAATTTSVPIHDWPALPPPSAALSKDPTRTRQHHRRLEQEQQGKPWNELRF